MAERYLEPALKASLKSNDAFAYYHLIKFEKPTPSGRDGATAGKATDFSYITDAQYNIDWDDGDADSEDQLLGSQKYIANKVLSIGGVQETTEARASTMALKLSAAALGVSAYDADAAFFTGNIFEGREDFVLAGLREGDKVLIEQDGWAGIWADNDYLVNSVVQGLDGLYYVCILQIDKASTDTAVTEPGTGTGWQTYWDYSNHNKEVRIDKFGRGGSGAIWGENNYSVNDEVRGLDGLYYTCLVAHDAAVDKTAEPGGSAEWDAGINYTLGMLVQKGGIVYEEFNISPSQFESPPNINFWDVKGPDTSATKWVLSSVSSTALSNTRLSLTIEGAGLAIDNNRYGYTLTNISEEINALIFAKSGSSTRYVNYINRNVFIYRVHANPETGIIVGEPFLIFKGIIAQGSIQENPEAMSTITWSLSSHWGDFARVQGRLTSDDSHRALDLTGRSDPEALLRPEYESDYGFMHADSSVNVLGTYQTQELRYKTRKRGGLAGWLGGKKVKEYYETVDRDVDLRFNLSAKYLPVVYGVQKVSSIPVFADISEEVVTGTDPQQLYLMYALCEGEIGGIYDIHVDETSSVCVDLNDFDAREPSGTASNEDSNVEVYCYGRADRGDVLSGGHYVNRGSLLPFPTFDFSGAGYRFLQRDGSFFGDELYENVLGVNTNNNLANTMGAGLLHEDTYSFTIPIDANFIIHTGKADQEADNVFVNRAANSPKGKGFKIQKDYYDGDPANYWSSSHRLLDTAYVSCVFTLQEGEATIPSYEFIVKGKYIQCYNYDQSYEHDEIRGSGDPESQFDLGDYVAIELSNGTGGYVQHSDPAAQNARIVDKWFIYDKQGNKSYRYTVDYEPMDLQGKTLLRFNNGGSFWHMKTYDHAEGSGSVLASPVATAISAVYEDDGNATQDSKLTVTLDGLEFDAFLNGNDGEAYIAFTNSPNTHFLVVSYTTGANPVIQLAPYSGAGYIAEQQNFPADMYISNLIYTTGLSIYETINVGDRIKVTRTIDGIKEHRLKEITYLAGSFAFVKSPFNESLVPSMSTTSWTQRGTLDTFASGIESDERVSINPSMQLLDYLTNTKYGKGLDIDNDLRLDTFKLSGILCDDKSKVTVVCDTAPTPGASYEFIRSSDSMLLFSGKVDSVVAREYNQATTYYEVVFTEVLGKLGYKWNDWQSFTTGDLVWGSNHVATVTSSATITEDAFLLLPAITGITLTKLGGGTSISVQTDRFGGVRNTNSIVRSWTPKEFAFSSPGYSLHDSDDVKYWKYLGWDQPTQRFVTRHQTNQVINTNTPLFDNINSMLNQFNGMMRYANGKYELDVKIGAPLPGEVYWEEGVTRLSDKDIIGNIKIDDKGLRQSYNSITANIVDPQNKYGARGISFFNSEYLKEDKGVPAQGNYSMPGISNYYNARTNIIQFLDESRYGLTATFTIDQKGYLTLAGSIVSLDYDRFDWYQKLFRIETLTLQPNGLVALVCKEHNDKAFLIDYSDRSAMDINPAPVNPTPTQLEPPVGLTATGTGGVDMLEGKIVLNWSHSPTYIPGSQLVEIYAQEGPTDVPDGTYTYVSPPFDEASSPITTIDAVTYTHEMPVGREDYVYHYWIRYVQYKNGRPSNYSIFEPVKSTLGGVEGEATAAITEAGYTITIDPASILLEADSFGQVPVGAYAHTSTSIRVLQAGLALDSIDPAGAAPIAGQFTVTASVPSVGSFPPDITIDDTPTWGVATPFTYGLMSAFDKSIRSTAVTYTVNVAGAFTQDITQPVASAVEGSDAWQVGGTNSTHIFIADSDGTVAALNNDFAHVPTVVKLGDIYTYDGVGPVYEIDSFRYGTVTSADIAPGIVNIDSGDAPAATGEISISDNAAVLTNGAISSATISIELIDNETNVVFGYVDILLTKAFSGIRGGKEFIFTAADFSPTDVSAWFTDPFTADTTASQAIVQEVIDLATNDGWIRPNDRITISDTSTDNAASRIWVSPGVDSGNIGTVSGGDFSTLVVEIFPGSVIVDGTLSADKIAANNIFSNNLRVASNLVIGDQSAIDNLDTVTVNVAGSGYTVGDILTLVGGEFISAAATVRVEAVATGTGNLQEVAIHFSGDYTTPPTSPNVVTGGTGTLAQIGFTTENFWGQLYSYQKTSYGDPSQGFFIDADGFFDVGDGGNYLRYNPDTGTVTLKGNLNITSSNSHLMTWEALGECSLDEFNLQVYNEAGGNGSVKSNTALGTGATAVCEPATVLGADSFYFGLADTIVDSDFSSGDITYGWHVNSTATKAKPSLGAGATLGSTDQAPEVTFTTGDLLQVMNDGTTIRWFHGITEVFTYTSGVTPKVYSWKGVFNTQKQSPAAFTTSIGLTAGVVANSSSGGAQGDPGQDAYAVNLTANTQAFTYDTASNLVGPASVVITATPLNTSLTEFYEFIVTDYLGVPVSVQNTTTATYTYTPKSGYANMPETVEVRLRQVANNNPVLATDQMTMAGLKEAGDSILISMSNETHSVPETNLGVVDLNGSGTEIEVYANGTQLSYDGAATPANSTFKITTTASGITVGAASGTTTRIFADAVAPMGADTAYIDFDITVKDSAGQSITTTKTQTFAKSKEGSQGTGSQTVTLTTDSYTVDYATDGTILSGVPTVTATTTNVSTPYYEFFVDGVSKQASSPTSIYAMSNGDAPGLTQSNVIEVRVLEGLAGLEVAIDSVGIYAVQSANAAPVAYLTNSAHTLPTDNAGTGINYTGSGTEVHVVIGITSIPYDALLSTTNTWRIASIDNVNITPNASPDTSTNDWAIYGDASAMGAPDTASLTFNIEVSHPSGAIVTLTLTQTFSKSIAGAGSDAFAVKLTADDYVAVYAPDGTTPVPATTPLVATAQNVATPWYKFTGDGIADDVSFSSTGTKTWTAPPAYFGTPHSIRVGVSNGDQVELTFDTITISAVKPGIDGENTISVIMSNESHSVPITGGTPDFTDSGTDLHLYEGATKLDFVLTGPIAGQWTIGGRNVSGVSEANTNPITVVVDAGGDYANSKAIDGISANTGFIQFPISGILADGTVFNGISKQQSFSRVSDGTDGTNGTNGNNTAIVPVYKRTTTNSPPASISTTETYTFSTSTLSANIDGWTQDIPAAGAAYLWVDQATAFSSTDTDTVLAGDWAGAILQGQDGTQAASLALYQRKATSPTEPANTDLTYTFATAALTGTFGLWTVGVPADNGNPVWITHTTALALNTVTADTNMSWSTAQKFATDGADGAAGAAGADGADGATGPTGSQGIAGTDGTDGSTTYFHVAYADSITGSGFSQSPTGKDYIGTYVDTNPTDSANAGDYTWALYVGIDGTQGIPGTNGTNGQTTYLHIAYASNSTGTSNFHLSDPTGRDYMGTYTDFNSADSTNAALYTWALYVGTDGTNGTNGTNGTPGANGAAMYTLLQQSSTASTQITGAKIGQVMFRSSAVEGDICIVRSATAAAAYRSSTTSTNGTWVESLVFVDGGMVVDGGIGARELLISNPATGSAGVYIGSTAIEVHDGTNLRVKLGQL